MINTTLIIDLTKRDFSERFAGSSLGALWAFIWPIVTLFIYIVIFGNLIGGRLPGTSNVYSYSIYLASGLLAWTAFASTITRSVNIFIDKKYLISKIKLSLPSLLLYIALAETVTFIFSMAVFFVFLIATGYPLNKHLVLVPFIYFLQQILALGIGLLAATLNVFIRDLREVVGIIIQLWFWFTPIIYVRDILPPIFNSLMKFNPAYMFIESYQRVFVYNDMPHMRSLIILTVLTHGLVLFAYFVFKKLEKDVRDLI